MYVTTNKKLAADIVPHIYPTMRDLHLGKLLLLFF